MAEFLFKNERDKSEGAKCPGNWGIIMKIDKYSKNIIMSAGEFEAEKNTGQISFREICYLAVYR